MFFNFDPISTFLSSICPHQGSIYAHLWHPWTLLGPSWPSLGTSWGHLRSHHGHQALILMPYCASLLPACFHMMPTCSISALSKHPRLQFWGKNSKDFNAWLLFKLMPCSQLLGCTLPRLRPMLVPSGPSLGTHGALLGPSWPSSGLPEVILRPP